MSPQKPLQLILARNLLTSLSTPAFLVDEAGALVFFNEAAGELLGKRFEEVGGLSGEDWIALFGPFDAAGEPMRLEEVSLTRQLRSGRPAHDSFHIRAFDGELHDMEVSALPIVTADKDTSRGAMIFFWPAEA